MLKVNRKLHRVENIETGATTKSFGEHQWSLICALEDCDGEFLTMDRIAHILAEGDISVYAVHGVAKRLRKRIKLISEREHIFSTRMVGFRLDKVGEAK